MTLESPTGSLSVGACSSDLPKELGRVVARFIKDTGMDRLKMFYAGFRGLKGNSGASSGLVCRSVLSWGFRFGYRRVTSVGSV